MHKQPAASCQASGVFDEDRARALEMCARPTIFP
jgi:hypothetical protein